MSVLLDETTHRLTTISQSDYLRIANVRTTSWASIYPLDNIA
jgi:hypothetical protein